MFDFKLFPIFQNVETGVFLMLQRAAEKVDPEKMYARGLLQQPSDGFALAHFINRFPEFRHEVKSWILRLLRARAWGMSFEKGFRQTFPFLNDNSINIYMTVLKVKNSEIIPNQGG